jgi:hypothetical protein
MTSSVGSTQDPALQPAAAAARTLDTGAEAARKAREGGTLEGRGAVQGVGEASTPPSGESPARGRVVDREA